MCDRKLVQLSRAKVSAPDFRLSRNIAGRGHFARSSGRKLLIMAGERPYLGHVVGAAAFVLELSRAKVASADVPR